MKPIIRIVIILFCLSLAEQITLPQPAAFHAGGVAPCDGCHTMHGTNLGQPSTTGGSSLLLASDPSSICLNCHAGPGGPNSPSVFSPDGSAQTPGGDFYWLGRTFTWNDGISPGESHGHNVIARDYGLLQDRQRMVSPGGSYRAAHLGCTSCHDPHGRVKGGSRAGQPPVSGSGSYGERPNAGTIRGNYRLLGDSAYAGSSAAGGHRFVSNAPVARQNMTDRFGESDSSHVDYGAGMSEWCGNCHAGILNSNHRMSFGVDEVFIHPIGSTARFGSSHASIYNAYVSSGNLNGSSATSYLQFVPFERGVTESFLLNPASTQGPDANARVSCLSCHRAHASAFTAMGRWDFTAVLLADSHPHSGDGGVTGNDVRNSYYGRSIGAEFGPDQGSFCEKCHGVPAPEEEEGQL